MRRSWPFLVPAVLLAAALGLSLSVGGYQQSSVTMASGTAWLASPQGLVTLVDGPSEQVIGTIRSGDTAAPPAVVQTGTSALLVDGEAGTVTRVDGTTYAVLGPVAVGEGPLQVLSDDSRTVVVQGGRGAVEVVDSTSLEVLREVAVGATVGAGQAVLSGDGTLWLVDSAGGGLSAVDGSGEVSVTHPVGDGAARLVTAAGRPVLADVSGGRLGAVDDSGDVSSWLCAGEELDANSRLLGAAASARVFAVSSATGRFVAADLAAGTCIGGVVAPPGADLGPLVEARGAVLVPDRTTGQVLVVDPATAGVMATPATVGPGTPFELIAKDGVVFWNDLAGPAAGVVSFRDGGWTVGTPLAKFSTGSTTVPSLAPATDSLPAGQVLSGLPPPATATTVTGGRSPTPGASTSASAATGTRATPGLTTATETATPTATTTHTSTSGPPVVTRLDAGFTASPHSGPAPLEVAFTDTSKGQPTSWSWDYGDDGKSVGSSVTHTYETAGSYTVTLTVRDAAGATATATDTIEVAAEPLKCSITPSPASGPAPLTVTLTSKCTGEPTSWSWVLGDGANASGPSATHTYGTAGSHTVTLTVRNAAGATVTATDTVEVTADAPECSITPSPASGPAPLTVTLTSKCSGEPTSWSWDLGDGASAAGSSVTHTYEAAGSYTVTLTATNAAGKGTATAVVTVTEPVEDPGSESPGSTATDGGAPGSGP